MSTTRRQAKVNARAAALKKVSADKTSMLVMYLKDTPIMRGMAKGVTLNRVASVAVDAMQIQKRTWTDQEMPTSMFEREQVANDILDLYALAPVGNRVGSSSVYDTGVGMVIRKNQLARGGYNRVFDAELVTKPPKRVVLRFVKHRVGWDDEDIDYNDTGGGEEWMIIMAFVETVIYSVLCKSMSVIPMLTPIKAARDREPFFEIGTVQPHMGDNSLFDFLNNNGVPLHKAFDEERLCGKLVMTMLALDELQHNYGLVHRDFKHDNIMLVDAEPGAPAMVQATADGPAHDTEGKRVAIIDFGFAQLHLNNKDDLSCRIACDCERFLCGMKFNDSIDTVYLAFNVLEDVSRELRKYAPHVYRLFNEMAGPLLHHLNTTHPHYRDMDTDSRTMVMLNQVYTFVEHGSWPPAKVVARLDDIVTKIRLAKKHFDFAAEP